MSTSDYVSPGGLCPVGVELLNIGVGIGVGKTTGGWIIESSYNSISAMHFFYFLISFCPTWTTVTLAGYYWIWIGYGVTHFVI